MRVLPHIEKLDAALGHFRVQITCRCGAPRIGKPEILTRRCGSSATLEAVGRRMRCSKCGIEGAEVAAVSVPHLRGREFPRRERNVRYICDALVTGQCFVRNEVVSSCAGLSPNRPDA